MIASIHRRSIALLPGLPLAVLGCLAINSCGSSKKNSQSGSPYASYPSDGHYNPYPTGSQGSVPRYQEYTEAPPPPPEPKPKPKSKPSVASNSFRLLLEKIRDQEVRHDLANGFQQVRHRPLS